LIVVPFEHIIVYSHGFPTYFFETGTYIDMSTPSVLPAASLKGAQSVDLIPFNAWVHHSLIPMVLWTETTATECGVNGRNIARQGENSRTLGQTSTGVQYWPHTAYLQCTGGTVDGLTLCTVVFILIRSGKAQSGHFIG